MNCFAFRFWRRPSINLIERLLVATHFCHAYIDCRGKISFNRAAPPPVTMKAPMDDPIHRVTCRLIPSTTVLRDICSSYCDLG